MVLVMVTALVMVEVFIITNIFICMLDGFNCCVSTGGGGNIGCGG